MTEPKKPEAPGETVLHLVTSYQTVGPYFKIGLEALYRHDLATAETPGRLIEIAGTVFDGDGAPVPDAMIALLARGSLLSFSTLFRNKESAKYEI